MSTILFEGDPEKGGIPRKSKVRVVSAPKNTTIFSGRVSRALALDLDPGKYLYSVTKIIGDKRVFNYTGEFYHDITPDAFEKLKQCKPSMVKAINTAEGPRWRCHFTGCQEEEFTSEVAALLHEVGHFGVDEKRFLENPDMRVLYEGTDKAAEFAEKKKKAEQAAGVAPSDPLELGSPVATSRG